MTKDKAPSRVQRYREYLQGEVDGAALYHALADAERDPNRAAVLRKLAETEERHAAHWLERLRALGEPVTELPRPRLSPRLLGFLARRFGTEAVLPVARALELRDGNMYAGEPEAGALAADERLHSHTVAALVATRGDGAATEQILGRERWHRARDGGGSLRAAIFGVNDGLVSNLSLVMGVAGAEPGPRFVLLSGVAGLLAGAFSMGAGEFVSVSAQRELFERQIALEREELAINPEEEREELALIYQAKGVPAAEAEVLAGRVMANPQAALDTMAREELGLNPEDLGSPWRVAVSSFTMFALGALVPVLPYLFTGGTLALVLSAVLSGVGLFGVGAAITLFTGRSPLLSGLRMLGIGSAAATVTYLVGKLIGVSVTG
jgi:VIT1/CCC1 family predicted Fe2+/Mn2+ transporter